MSGMANDFRDLADGEFQRADMSGTRFSGVSLNRARFLHSALHQVVMRGVEIVDTTIDGEIHHLVINGVDVAPLVEAELDRWHPDRPKFRPATAEGFREAWDLNERLWAATVDRARKLAPELLHASVDGEWSFIQTLRHLAFAGESWVGRCILGDPTPGTRSRCPGTRWTGARACPGTAMPGPRSRRRSLCAMTRWPSYGGSSTPSPTSSSGADRAPRRSRLAR